MKAKIFIPTEQFEPKQGTMVPYLNFYVKSTYFYDAFQLHFWRNNIDDYPRFRNHWGDTGDERPFQGADLIYLPYGKKTRSNV